jgi:hypothetical protein
MTGRARPAEISSCVLRIDELVLHGFHGIDRYAVAGAIERELGRLLGEAGTQRALLAREQPARDGRLDAGSFVVAAGATPDAVGVQVARAIHRSLEGTRANARVNPSPSRDPSVPGGTR